MKKSHSLILCLFICIQVSADEPTNSLAGRYRQEGVAAQTQGRLLDARNAWYKYLAVKKLEPGFSDNNEMLRIKTWVAELSPAPVEPMVPAVTPHVAIAAEKKTTKPARLSSDELMRKADMLRKNGQLDEALRFYRLAEEASPSDEIKKRIQDLEAEMN